jgi:2-methylcitrate dehydratase PrpD
MPNAGDEAKTKSKIVAEFIAGFDLAQAPEKAIDNAETAFLDTIGVMLAGSREPAARIVCEVVAAEGAAPAATVVGRQFRTSPSNAALANGTATQALDFDLSFLIGQSSAALVPGLLPLAESIDATPQALISAYIVGCEVCARLARSFPTLSSEGGWHGAGVLGAVAAAASFARLTDAPVDRIPDIIGISASMASGIGAGFGTMTKPLHAGLAAQSGILALSLGTRGFTGNSEALEGRQGLFASFAQGLNWDAAPFDDLGQTFDLLGPGFKIKPFACGGLMHTSIEATLALRDQVVPRIDDISSIKIGISPHAYGRALDVYPWSEDSARFSLPYLIAYTILHGAPLLPAFKDEAIAEATVRALADHVEVGVDDEFASLTGSGYSPARVTIGLDDGESFENAVYHPPGSLDAPMSDDQIDKKFLACASEAMAETKATQLRDYLRKLRNHDTLQGLWPLLVAETGD